MVISLMGLGSSTPAAGEALLGGGVGSNDLAAAEALSANWVEASS
jgi:hypothetical protein